MTWYTYSLLAILFWSGSDLFSKMSSKHEDKYSQFRIMAILGITMGLHAIFLLFTSDALKEDPFRLINFWYYLPAGALYILSMVLGYIGLRYMVLSVSSPICNASGAVEILLCWLILGQTASLPAILSALLLTAAVILLAIVESKNPTDEIQNGQRIHMTKKEIFMGLALPIAYCCLDAAGTMAETIMYDAQMMSEDAGSVTYELMWLVIGLGSLIYLCFFKKQSLIKWPSKGSLVGQSICETLGNYFYIYAIATDYAILAQPMIGCYAVISVLWGRLILKEKLTPKHYLCIAMAVVGIALLGWFNG
jgi:drug/metabolite transporter (DMT)-like permease